MFGVSVDVGYHAGHQPSPPLNPHHRVQASISFPVFCPELGLFERERLTRFGDRFSADSVEDELAPEFVFGAELEVFPRSLTS